MGRLLPQKFALEWADTDPLVNLKLREYEESLFLNHQADELVYLAGLIRKTERQGDLYDTVSFGNQQASFPRPFLYNLRPTGNHPKHEAARSLSRVVCLYDNAGEDFLPGSDSTATPTTRHLAQAFLFLFLFDPLQDLRFHQLCRTRKLSLPTPEILYGSRLNRVSSRQEIILTEAANRVRRSLGLGQTEKHKRPLVIVVTKYDVWRGLLEKGHQEEPFRNAGNQWGLDRALVEGCSHQVRELLCPELVTAAEGFSQEVVYIPVSALVCPELVTAAEGFSQEVVYIPVSALGNVPKLAPKGLAIRLRDINPLGVTVPLLYGLSRWLKGLVATVKTKPAALKAKAPISKK
jgi:hypothetical protein